MEKTNPTCKCALHKREYDMERKQSYCGGCGLDIVDSPSPVETGKCGKCYCGGLNKHYCDTKDCECHRVSASETDSNGNPACKCGHWESRHRPMCDVGGCECYEFTSETAPEKESCPVHGKLGHDPQDTCCCGKERATPDPKELSWEEEFDDVVRPLGAKGTLCLVPEVNQSCEFWVLQQREAVIKDFIRQVEEKAFARGCGRAASIEQAVTVATTAERERIIALIRAERDKKHACQHTTPTATISPSTSEVSYCCDDIHLGRQEFASDILQALQPPKEGTQEGN